MECKNEHFRHILLFYIRKGKNPAQAAKKLRERINACDLHLKRNEFDSCLKRIITGDEKWIVYNNVVRKRPWFKRDEPPQTTLKAELHQKKIMLSVWWDWKGMVFFELLPRNQTINSDIYYRQLN